MIIRLRLWMQMITSRRKFLIFLMNIMKICIMAISEKQILCSISSEISTCTLRMISVCTYSRSVRKIRAKVSRLNFSKKP
ncbi:hypothetical protein AR158_C769L [Paramecium bursaria Chlorella virus AR158]|uniref:hypothetical protein n=1 Tax=Paramecium bursaria Chlorella virus AR158 TaxID=380598 RepID=UPI00015AA8CE|nr:hypothetical protein AR158_C769L [Paramecium bursaria Chlorella virus AR158]ABU44314.1 hypothetical protein AR158_C769L [Paramecium bursaria Chlorella virus AR158]